MTQHKDTTLDERRADLYLDNDTEIRRKLMQFLGGDYTQEQEDAAVDYIHSLLLKTEVGAQLAAVNHLDDKIFYIETNPRGDFIKRVINRYRDELSEEYQQLRRPKGNPQ